MEKKSNFINKFWKSATGVFKYFINFINEKINGKKQPKDYESGDINHSKAMKDLYNHASQEKQKWIKDHWIVKFPKNPTEFEFYWNTYENIVPFKINENIFESNPNIEFTIEVQYIIKLSTTYDLINTFKSMKIDLTDPNVLRDKDNGNIGTPGRVAKMWVGSGLDDDSELLSGRFTKAPRLAKFPNTSKQHFPIVKKIDLVAVCSHHLAPFSTMFREDSYAMIAYIPKDYVLGISKVQRFSDWITRRGWLQEDLTQALCVSLQEIAETEDVYVSLHNIVHTCESLRGAQSKDGSFSSVYFGGKFKADELQYQLLLK